MVTHDVRIREIAVALGMLVYAYWCSCGGFGHASTEAEIRRAHPYRRVEVADAERAARPVIRIVKGATQS